MANMPDNIGHPRAHVPQTLALARIISGSYHQRDSPINGRKKGAEIMGPAEDVRVCVVCLFVCFGVYFGAARVSLEGSRDLSTVFKVTGKPPLSARVSVGFPTNRSLLLLTLANLQNPTIQLLPLPNRVGL